MEIDFENLQNAAQNGKIIKQKELKDFFKKRLEEENILIENAKKECAELKKMFINIINNDVKEQLDKGQQYIRIKKNIETPALIKKNYLFYFRNRINYSKLSNLCDEFDYNSFIEPIEKKINIEFYDNSPKLVGQERNYKVETYINIDIFNKTV